jgi:hypothetical protein
VEERGFAVVGEGRLGLAVRDRSKLGMPAPSDPLPESAPFVTFYKLGTNPMQGGGRDARQDRVDTTSS